MSHKLWCHIKRKMSNILKHNSWIIRLLVKIAFFIFYLHFFKVPEQKKRPLAYTKKASDRLKWTCQSLPWRNQPRVKLLAFLLTMSTISSKICSHSKLTEENSERNFSSHGKVRLLWRKVSFGIFLPTHATSCSSLHASISSELWQKKFKKWVSASKLQTAKTISKKVKRIRLQRN